MTDRPRLPRRKRLPPHVTQVGIRAYRIHLLGSSFTSTDFQKRFPGDPETEADLTVLVVDSERLAQEIVFPLKSGATLPKILSDPRGIPPASERRILREPKKKREGTIHNGSIAHSCPSEFITIRNQLISLVWYSLMAFSN